MKFAYELRKHDTNDQFTRKLLDNNVQPVVLVDIIAANKWDQESQCMVPHPDQKAFTIQKDDTYYLMAPQPQAQAKHAVIGQLDQMENNGLCNKFYLILQKDGDGVAIEYEQRRLVSSVEQ